MITENTGSPGGLRTAVTAAVRQLPRRRLIAIAVVAVILVAGVILIPLPTPIQLRDWATSAGPWFPLAFLAAHIVVTVFPFPRTAFTLAAGLLFGPALGIGLAVLASTVSAVAALLLIRALGWQLHRLVKHPGIDGVNDWLYRRGWPSVISLRLIPVVPFSALNYAAGASTMRVVPYGAATIVGLLPGTAAVVLLGNALTGDGSPLLLVVSVGAALVGVAGLAWETRKRRREPAGESPSLPERYAA